MLYFYWMYLHLDSTIFLEMFPNVCNHQPCNGRFLPKFCNQRGKDANISSVGISYHLKQIRT